MIDLAGFTSLEQLVERAREDLRARMTALEPVLQIGRAEWSLSQDDGTMRFRRPDGVTVVAEVQIIATFNSRDRTWLWGWDHPSVTAALGRAAARVREVGVHFQNASLTTRKIKCKARQQVDLLALACYVNGAQAALALNADGTKVFVVLDKVRMLPASTGQ